MENVTQLLKKRLGKKTSVLARSEDITLSARQGSRERACQRGGSVTEKCPVSSHQPSTLLLKARAQRAGLEKQVLNGRLDSYRMTWSFKYPGAPSCSKP